MAFIRPFRPEDTEAVKHIVSLCCYLVDAFPPLSVLYNGT